MCNFGGGREKFWYTHEIHHNEEGPLTSELELTLYSSPYIASRRNDFQVG